MARAPKRFSLNKPEIKQHNRLSTAKRGYGGRWQRYRVLYLARHPICVQCNKAAATDVDHIKRIHGPTDPLFWKPTNHQALCHSCHSRKTSGETKE